MAKRERARLHCINNQAKLSQLLQESLIVSPIEIEIIEKNINKSKMQHQEGYLWISKICYTILLAIMYLN